jgi:ribosomal protein L11 methyltransferase
MLQCGASAVAEEECVAEQECVAEKGSVTEETGVALTGDVDVDRLADLRAWLDLLSPPPTVQFPEVDPSWVDAWREHAVAVVAGPFVVRPPWVEPDPTLLEPDHLDPGEPVSDERFPIELVVDPGHTFGSGSHPSTRMSLVALADLVAHREGEPPTAPGRGDGSTKQWTVADIGCGSGVLATGALLLGAATAVGVDVDPDAGDVSRAVARANGVGSRYVFREGGIGALRARRQVFQVVLANLLIPVIEELGDDIRAICAPLGVVVLSGLLVEHRTRALAALGVTEVVAEYRSEGWLTLVVPGAAS